MCDIEKQDSLSQIEKLVASPHEILIVSDGEGGFIASIPSLPGCLSCGETQDEAMQNVMDAKCAWITAAIEDGIAIPDPVLSKPFLAKMQKYYGKPIAEISETTEPDRDQPVGAELDACEAGKN